MTAYYRVVTVISFVVGFVFLLMHTANPDLYHNALQHWSWWWVTFPWWGPLIYPALAALMAMAFGDFE